jgi:hypothetical protein
MLTSFHTKWVIQENQQKNEAERVVSPVAVVPKCPCQIRWIRTSAAKLRLCFMLIMGYDCLSQLNRVLREGLAP